jgi:hypothetical protein
MKQRHSLEITDAFWEAAKPLLPKRERGHAGGGGGHAGGLRGGNLSYVTASGGEEARFRLTNLFSAF